MLTPILLVNHEEMLEVGEPAQQARELRDTGFSAVAIVNVCILNRLSVHPPGVYTFHKSIGLSPTNLVRFTVIVIRSVALLVECLNPLRFGVIAA